MADLPFPKAIKIAAVQLEQFLPCFLGEGKRLGTSQPVSQRHIRRYRSAKSNDMAPQGGDRRTQGQHIIYNYIGNITTDRTLKNGLPQKTWKCP